MRRQLNNAADAKAPSRRKVLATALAAGASLMAPRAAFAATGTSVNFKAGAGRADVHIPAMLFPLDGFVGQHDPLVARVLLLDDGHSRVGIVVIDLTSIEAGLITSVKAILAKVAAVSPENAIVCASHTFSAPHVFPAGQEPPGTDLRHNAGALQAIEAAVRTAAVQAASTLQPAWMGFGLGTSRVSVNRDVPTPHGWWLGANDAGFSDPSLGILRVDGANGKPIAILMNYAVQSSIMDGSVDDKGGKLITADLAGAATSYVETQYGGGTVAFFLVGAAGDQAPYLKADRYIAEKDGSIGRADIHDAGFTLVDLLGERLGSDAMAVAETIKATQAPSLDVLRESIEVPGLAFSPRNAAKGPVTSFDYQPDGKIKLPIVLIYIGDIAFVGMQPELAASLGARLKAGSAVPHTMVATMVDGSAKYLPDAQSYDRFTYEARSSPFARGAGEQVVSAATALLRQVHDKQH